MARMDLIFQTATCECSTFHFHDQLKIWGIISVKLDPTWCVTKIVGGFNPSEKYARQIGSFPQIGMKIKNVWNHHPVLICTLSLVLPCFRCISYSFPFPPRYLHLVIASMMHDMFNHCCLFGLYLSSIYTHFQIYIPWKSGPPLKNT